MTPPLYDPRQDGVSHINVYSKGRTVIGREASNFSFRPFRHPEFGNFSSVEAFWYWLSSGRTHDEIRHLFGASAKMVGSRLEPVPMNEEEFRDRIREAIRCKFEQHTDLKQALIESTLPFAHYYVRGIDAIVHKKQHDWQMDYLTELRDEFRNACPDVSTPTAGHTGLEPESLTLYRNLGSQNTPDPDDLFNGIEI